MPTARTARREGRLLVTVATLGRHNGRDGASLDDLVAIDFLLAHPAVLRTFIELDRGDWSEAARPSNTETDSSEETFLRWKRSVALRAAAPMLGRLLGRRLITWNGGRGTGLAATKEGLAMARELKEAIPENERERVDRVASEFSSDTDAHERLRRSLAEVVSDGH